MLAPLMRFHYPDVFSSHFGEQGKRKKPGREEKIERIGEW
jgi:hypothetical protein